MFLIPGMLPEPFWDFNMATDQFNYAQMKKYLNLACRMPLRPIEQEQLLRSLKADKEHVFHIDMCPSKLPDLVTHNPSIAKHIIIYMTNTAEISKYYDMLASMRLSINLLEVFDNVQQHVSIPKEFTQLFVKNCMDQCNQPGPKNVQKNRQVRIVIVFLTGLIKSRALESEDSFESINQFCIDNSKVKEAQDLLKIIYSQKS